MKVKRVLDRSTMKTLLKIASEVLEMHGSVAGDRVCQDWSGEEESTPSKLLTAEEFDDIYFNYEIDNSDLREYSEGCADLDDEMVLSFALSKIIGELADNI
jgi:hypothetical protein